MSAAHLTIVPSIQSGQLPDKIDVVALGQAALRPGSAIEVLDVGVLFAGQYVLTMLGLHFDLLRGLYVEFTAQRAPGSP
jgi:hypothetical protein